METPQTQRIIYKPAGVRRTRLAEAAQWTQVMCREGTRFHDGSMEGPEFPTRYAPNEATITLGREDLGA